MKILGLDPASTTGWSLIEDDRIIDYGTIITNSTMHIGQRLNYIALELDRLLEKTKPDMIAIEDVLLGISGVKTLSLLARISGVIIQRCFNKYQKQVHIMNVASWKKGCGLNLKGTAAKWEIQYAIVNYFGLLTEDQDQVYKDIVFGECVARNHIKNKIEQRKKELDQVRKKGKKEKIDLSCEERTIKKGIDAKKKELKLTEKSSSKVYQKMMKDIYAVTGISEDVADSMGIALAARNLQSSIE